MQDQPLTGKTIREKRLKLGLTYEAMSEILGVDPVTIRRWEKSETVKPIIWYALSAIEYAGVARN